MLFWGGRIVEVFVTFVNGIAVNKYFKIVLIGKYAYFVSKDR